MAKINRPKKTKQEAFRYSKMPDGLELYFFVSLLKGIVWLVKTPIKWVIKKMK
ncbi:MAG TPA: hypothetical protein VIS75_10380 [Chitinophagaceae bacterium]